MIFTDFAPNETSKDAVLAIQLLFQPWRWQKGKEIQNLKRRLKSRFFSKDTTISLFLTGRAALYQYLSTLDLETGDEILVQAFTCEAVILPILELGLTPIYVDVNESDYAINPNDLERKLTPKAKALIIQHTFGITPHYRKSLIDIAKKNNLHIIEDVAHGFDTKLYQSKHYPGAVLMSFGRSKLFSSMFGGAVAVRGVRSGLALKKYERALPNSSVWMLLQIVFYKLNAVIIKSTYKIMLGKIIHFMFKQFDLMMPEVTKREKAGHFNTIFLRTYPNCAAIFMLEQLNRFNDVSRKRKKSSAFFDIKFNTNIADGLGLLRYPVLCNNPDAIRSRAIKQGIQLGRWYSQAVAPSDLNLDVVEYKKGSCPIAESMSKRVINLPTHISIQEANQISEIITRV